ncbi:hypothetical protein ACIQUB_26685 [Rhizobium sp. NPDC090275]|uniref:hypothetical protein n=1 Tax=Rhizobium sp. NPDC090275 TaxID=3364498 RepID=UPI00383A889E
MENTKTKKQNEVGAAMRGARGLSAAAGSWFVRFLDYSCVVGNPTGLPGLMAHSEAARPRHQSPIDI